MGKSKKMSKKGYNSATTSPTEKKKNTGPLNFRTYATYKFQDHISNDS